MPPNALPAPGWKAKPSLLQPSEPTEEPGRFGSPGVQVAKPSLAHSTAAWPGSAPSLPGHPSPAVTREHTETPPRHAGTGKDPSSSRRDGEGSQFSPCLSPASKAASQRRLEPSCALPTGVLRGAELGWVPGCLSHMWPWDRCLCHGPRAACRVIVAHGSHPVVAVTCLPAPTENQPQTHSPNPPNPGRSWGQGSFVRAGSVAVSWQRCLVGLEKWPEHRCRMSDPRPRPRKGNGMERPRTKQHGSDFLNTGEGGRGCFLAGRPPTTCPSCPSWEET